MSDFDPAAFFARYGASGHNGHVGTRYHAHGPDWAELALDPDPRLMVDAGSGILASGPIVAMMDMAAGMALAIRRGRMSGQPTLDLRIDYLRPARPGGTVFGRAECYRITRRIAFVRGQAHDGDADDPLAHVAGTFMLLDGEQEA